jgi:hypothetical protein
MAVSEVFKDNRGKTMIVFSEDYILDDRGLFKIALPAVTLD